MDNGLSANADKWPIPHDLSIDEINGLIQEFTQWSKSNPARFLRMMLVEMLNNNLTTICTSRDLSDEPTRLRMIAALSKVDLLILLTKESLGMVETLQNRLLELTSDRH